MRRRSNAGGSLPTGCWAEGVRYAAPIACGAGDDCPIRLWKRPGERATV